ncbi:MAG: phosphocholine cytidylyltransferase family protein [Nitrospirota bacterium]|nr:phosphocholine cytidylyltransferase family protein [Nitrospirota bacterium]
MNAIILSAGQGKRLLPLTEDQPKCIIPIHGQSILEWQIQELRRFDISPIYVVIGFGATKVEQVLAKQRAQVGIHTLYNPFYGLTDNLISCWIARNEMTKDFILLNGDTVFESAVLERLLQAPPAPITLVTDEKLHYDADDMKVIVKNTQLVRIGKTLPLETVNGESIGMIRFQDNGPHLFCSAIEHRVRQPESLKQWYLSLIDELAQQGHVSTVSIKGFTWAEIDNPADLHHAEMLLKPFAP